MHHRHVGYACALYCVTRRTTFQQTFTDQRGPRPTTPTYIERNKK